MNDKERNKKFISSRDKVVALRTSIETDTINAVLAMLDTASASIDKVLGATPTDYQAWNLPQLQQAIDNAATELNAQATAQVSGAMDKSWQTGIDLIDKPAAAGGVEIAAVLPQIDTRQLMAMRTFTTGRIKDVTTVMANKINADLGLVAIGAQTSGQAISNIETLLASSRSRATTILRTELGRSFSVASNERLMAARKILPGMQKQWRRSAKIHSRPSHDGADGQIVDADKPFTLYSATGVVTLMYPRAPSAPASETINCGCESLPYMSSWEVKNPGRVPFTDDELKQSAYKRALASALPVSKVG